MGHQTSTMSVAIVGSSTIVAARHSVRSYSMHLIATQRAVPPAAWYTICCPTVKLAVLPFLAVACASLDKLKCIHLILHCFNSCYGKAFALLLLTLTSSPLEILPTPILCSVGGTCFIFGRCWAAHVHPGMLTLACFA